MRPELVESLALTEDGLALISGTVYVAGQVGLTDAVLWGRHQSGSGVNWERRWESDGAESASVVRTAPDGSWLLGGESATAVGAVDDVEGSRAFVAELNVSGEAQWVTRWADSGATTGAAAFGPGNSIYVGGTTLHDLAAPNAGPGYGDAVVCRLDPSGKRQWCDQWGSVEDDEIWDMSVDAEGNVYSVGYAEGSLDGQDHAGNDDPFVTKHSADGTRLWTRQFGGVWLDQAYDVLLDGSTHLYTVGDRGTLVRWTADGDLVWQASLGTPSTRAVSIFQLNSSELLMVGWTSAGELNGQESQGGRDVFVVRWELDADGAEPVWTRLYGTAEDETVAAAALSAQGVLYVAGDTRGAFPGFENAGQEDPFLLRIELE